MWGKHGTYCIISITQVCVRLQDLEQYIELSCLFAAAGGGVGLLGHGTVAVAPVHPNLPPALHPVPQQLPVPVPCQFGRAGGLRRPRRGLSTLP